MVWRPREEWGSHLWAFIHTMTIIDSDQPEVQRDQVDKAVSCLRGLVAALPCPKCRCHLEDALEGVDNKDICQEIYKPMGLFEWGVGLHNAINRRLGKKEWTVQDALERWGKVI